MNDNNSDEVTMNSIKKLLPIRMISTVIHGYGRGSKDLGIPTANLDLQQLQSSCPFDHLPTGIYWGYARIVNTTPTTTINSNDESTPSLPTIVYPTAISIGYNPTYGNITKTVEPHLIASDDDPRRHASSTGETILYDFYDTTIRLSIIDYLRPELPFEGLDKLIVAIKQDISNTQIISKELLNDHNKPNQEISWVQSNDPTIV